MANNHNLQPGIHTLTVEEQSRGGKKSAKVRKEKRQIREIFKEVLESPANSNGAFNTLAEKFGLSPGTTSAKELAVVALLFNTLQSGGVSDISKIEEYIGEATDTDGFDDAPANIEVIVEDASGGY